DTAGAGGEVLIRHTNAVANKAIALNAAIVASGGAAVEAGDTGGAGAVVTILNDSGNISVHNITADGGAPGGGTAGVGGTIQLKTGVTGNTIGQAGATALLARGGTAGTNDGSLKVDSKGAVTLSNTGNNVGTVAASVADNTAAFSFTDATALTIGTVNAAGTGAASLGQLDGISTKGGDVTVTAGTGSAHTLTIDQAINTTPTVTNTAGGKVFLTAADAITSTAVTGTITTTGSLSAVAGADTAGAGGEVLIRHT